MATNGGSGLAWMYGIQAVTGAYSAYQQGRAQRAIAKANEAMMRTKAEIAEMSAEDALKRGHEAEAMSRSRYKKLLGKQRATLAAQGIRLDFGSATDIQQETQDISELDALTIKNNAIREAFGYRAEGRGMGMQAGIYGMEGNLYSQMAKRQAMDTLLSGGINAYEAYLKYGAK